MWLSNTDEPLPPPTTTASLGQAQIPQSFLRDVYCELTKAQCCQAGRWIWLDALETGLPVRFALLTAFNSGPPGLLVYLLTRAVLQKPEDKDEQVTKV